MTTPTDNVDTQGDGLAAEPPAGGAPAIPSPPPADTVTIQTTGIGTTALAGLESWFEAHVRDSAISRDTRTYNAIFHAVSSIKTALATLKE